MIQNCQKSTQKGPKLFKIVSNRSKIVQNRSKSEQNAPKLVKTGSKSIKMDQNGPKCSKIGPNLVKIGRKWSQMGQNRSKMVQNGFWGSFEILLSLLGVFPLYSLQQNKKVFFFAITKNKKTTPWVIFFFNFFPRFFSGGTKCTPFSVAISVLRGKKNFFFAAGGQGKMPLKYLAEFQNSPKIRFGPFWTILDRF